MTYKYKNRICPVCKKLINPYFYTFNKDDEKIHIECEKNNDVIGEKIVYVGDESS